MWLKHKITGKPAPIEAVPSENGNLLVKGGLYRTATAQEIVENAKSPEILDFATCAFAASFAKGK